jgi:ribosomal protein L11 methyltransferase
MPKPPLRRVSTEVPLEQAEAARATMLEIFPDGFEEVPRGGRVELAAYTDGSGAARMWRAFGEHAWREVPADWEERWRRFHRPVRIGRLWVGPPWERPPEGAVAVAIDPGRAFGTGAHESTRLCLEHLLEQEPCAVLDVGCGSGVLAIAAARLGFAPVVAVDHDGAAVETARENARANGVDIDVRLLDAATDELPPAELVLANISASAIEEVAARLEAARVVASGYLESDRPDLPGYRWLARRTAAGWASDLYRRPE